MRSVHLHGVTKSYDGEVVLQNLSLSIPSGKFFALLGPSGCGKTTILRLIGGFEQVDEGDITIGEQVVTHLPSNKRGVNTVFQNYALFPHLNVFDNVAYSLTVRGVDSETIKQRVTKLITSFGIEKHAFKSITQLSGGQQQRVALARAVINEPDVLLLDEPLAALDPKLREKMLVELIDLQDMLKTTFIYVTHDPFEALTVADQLAIMNADGAIEQVGTPQEIYEFPVSSFVAKFVGTTNILEGLLSFVDGRPHVIVPSLGAFPVDIERQLENGATWLSSEASVFLSIRPEKIMIAKRFIEGYVPKLSGRVENMVYNGLSTLYHVRVSDDFVLRVFEQNEEHIKQETIDYDDMVHLYWHDKNVVVLER